jgi:2-oxoacid:acceptor oxidoreductase gamma subunit (pyruvate/2-ketoisovalerate family)
MFQVRFHGRRGQGVVTAAELLASAAFREGRYGQALLSFGSERMGAPVMSFCRIDDKPIRTHEPVTEPDALIIQDPTLLHQADLLQGLGRDGYMLVNSARDFAEVGLDEFVSGFHADRLLVVPARSRRATPPPHGPHSISSGTSTRRSVSRRHGLMLKQIEGSVRWPVQVARLATESRPPAPVQARGEHRGHRPYPGGRRP